ncbi:hypothetical protein GO988_15780 [Hymenobacter sp. HMF4947]|uniref:Uncharacterized protein n=1 Tax=Hymenobacter ginkgonis TaxID=2682976 RepID=A0A7K1THZ9_9BACT|nr:hypothetical protein [Hymenobacter ginkgonis]MVN77791.1 hypothetical protein [Hymenobacter ginkgonis]
MHNIDRTLQEFETGAATNGEYENSFETSGEYGQELGQEFEQEFSNETFELSNEQEQLANELLEVSNEQELSHFLGGLIQKAAGAASGLLKSPVGQGVGRYLIDLGKKTLPGLASQAGAALGGKLGAQGARLGAQAGQWAGTQATNWLASNAQRVFGLELEALSPESQELEIARSYVRFATDVARRAHHAQRRQPHLRLGALGRQVLSASAPLYAPGLLQEPLPMLSGPARRAESGSWVRRGGTLVLYDV